MYMTRNRILFWIFSFLASVAIALGICLIFLGTKDINDVPNTVKLEAVGENYYLTTDYNAEYCYQFKLEQKFNEEFVVIETVESKTNSYNLKNCKLEIIPGQFYRFSARYIAENGSGDAEFSEGLVWQAESVLEQVKRVEFNQDTKRLSWEDNGADFYKVILLNSAAEEVVFSTEECFYNLSDLELGEYRAFVSACSENQSIKDSNPTGNVSIFISRKNQVKNATFDGESLTVLCTEKVEKFCIVKEEKTLAVVSAGDPFEIDSLGNYVYVLTGAHVYFENGAQIKSESFNWVIESELTMIEV